MRILPVILITFILCSQLFPQQLIIKLNEGFESSPFPPAGWKRVSPLGANQWERKTAPLPPEIMQPPVQGNSVARINFEYTGGEDWLITKKICSIEDGDSLIFYFIKQSDQGPFPPDSLLIKVSTTDSLLNSFSNLLLNINVAGLPTGNQTWRRYSLPLTQFSGQNIFIAFHHKDVNGHGCAIDSIVVFNPNSIGISKLGNSVPDKCRLFQNYPNPFNPSTIIRFQISYRKPELVTLKIFDVLGREVSTLFRGYLSAGIYFIPFSVNSIANYQFHSGIYFYRLESGEYNEIKKMILIK